MPDTDSPPASANLLDRPKSQRVLEFRYRLGQSVVFGLPVLALEGFGRSLGGAEADRWVSVLQALLAGWVVYVGAGGMLAEGMLLLLLRRRAAGWLLADATVALVTLCGYVLGAAKMIGLIFSALPRWPSTFHACVLLVAAWSALRWWVVSRSVPAQ